MTENESPDAPPTCPKCQGDMWDNRANKRNPRAPDYKCKDRGCEGVIWPSREAVAAALAAAPPNEENAAGGDAPALTPVPGAAGTPDDPACPVCGGKMWDDRNSKRNPRAPDFKCRNKPKFKDGPGCPGIIWPPREGERPPSYAPRATPARTASPRSSQPTSEPPEHWKHVRPHEDDDLPF